MNMPPPLPTSTAFVTVLGRISLVLAILSVLWALAQMLLALILPEALVAQVAAQPEAPARCGASSTDRRPTSPAASTRW